MRTGHRLWMFIGGVLFYMSVLAVQAQSASGGFSPAQQTAVNAALDQLILDGDWQTARKVVEQYLPHEIHNPDLFERGLITYFNLGAYDEVGELAGVAAALYPDYPAFYRYQAQMKARNGRCVAANSLWQSYLDASYFPIRQAAQQAFDHYCGTNTTHSLHPLVQFAREERLNAPSGSHEVTPQDGSLLDQFCALQITLCPADGIFSLEAPPPPRNAMILGVRTQAAKRYSWRHRALVSFEVGQHLGGYRKRTSHLSARLERRLSPVRQLAIGVGAQEMLTPAYKQHAAYRSLMPYISFEMREALSHKISSSVQIRYASAQNNVAQTMRTTNQIHIENHYIWAVNARMRWGAYASTTLINPPRNDANGKQWRTAYGVNYQHQTKSDLVMGWHYERSRHRVSKTLPFLTEPHRIFEKRHFLRISKAFGEQKRMIPFVSLSQSMRRSDNPRYQGDSHAIFIGLALKY